MDKEKILVKIKKCLALSRSANEFEAAQALKHAQMLMEQHDLTENDVDMADVAEYRVKSAHTLPSWHWSLIHICSRAFGCERFLSHGNGGQVVFLGVGGRAELAAYAYEVLLRQLKQARRMFMKTELSRVRIQKNKTYRADMFCQGWVDTVCSTVHAFAMRDGEKELLTRYLEGRYGKMGTAKLRDVKVTGHAKNSGDSSYWDGRDAGAGVKIHSAVGAAATGRLLN